MSALYHCMRSKDMVGYERSISSRSHSASDVLGGVRGGGDLARGQSTREAGPDVKQQDGGVPARDSQRTIYFRSTGLAGLSISLRITGVVLFVHNALLCFTLRVFLEQSLHFIWASFYLGPGLHSSPPDGGSTR